MGFDTGIEKRSPVIGLLFAYAIEDSDKVILFQCSGISKSKEFYLALAGSVLIYDTKVGEIVGRKDDVTAFKKDRCRIVGYWEEYKYRYTPTV